MTNRLSRRLFAAGLCTTLAATAKQPTNCAICGAPLPGHYLTYDGKACCSERCVNKLRPQCASCGCPIAGSYLESDGKIYCSEACFNKTLPHCDLCGSIIHSGVQIGKHRFCDVCAKKPACFSCGLPALHATHLSDGRDVCSNCMRCAIKTSTAGQKHYDLALRNLEAWTRLKVGSVPELQIVDRKQMMEQATDLRKTDSPVSIRGLYSRQTHMIKRGIFGQWKKDTEKSTETIYIVNYLHDSVFRVAAVHELMHDLIYEHFPHLEKAPLWVHEGICQQAAAEYCRRRNYTDILLGIETCTDPDYGDGYRYINKLTGFEGWNALHRWIKNIDVSTLPPVAPT